MKTTVELPDDLFREAKATAAQRGVPLKVVFREALEASLSSSAPRLATVNIPGDLLRRAKEAARAQGATTAEFLSSALAAKLKEEHPADEPDAKHEWPYPPLKGVPIEELRRIDQLIEEEFEQIEPEDWE